MTLVHRIQVLEVAVHPAFRRRGLGTQLMCELLQSGRCGSTSLYITSPFVLFLALHRACKHAQLQCSYVWCFCSYVWCFCHISFKMTYLDLCQLIADGLHAHGLSNTCMA